MMPNSPVTFSAPSGGRGPLVPILIGVLALGTVGFGIAAVVAFGQAGKAKTTLETQKSAAATAARADQKKTDETAATQALNSPYRTYTAPLEYGSFTINFPKTWSGYVIENRGSAVQVSLAINPDFVHVTNGVDDLMAARISLNQRTLSEYAKQFASEKNVKQSDITVDGIAGKQFVGAFSDKKTKRLVAIPVRDKTLVFSNENPSYAPVLDEILAQSKINP